MLRARQGGYAMPRFIEVPSPSGDQSYFIDLDAIKYIHVSKAKPATCMLHFGEADTLTIGMTAAQVAEQANRK